MPGTILNAAPVTDAGRDRAATGLRWPLRPLLAIVRRNPPYAERRVAEERVLTPGEARAFLNRAERSFRPPPG